MLVRTDGRQVSQLARLRRIGHAWPSWLEVLPDGLIDIEWRHNRLFLRPDGRRFASASLSRRAITLSSAVALPFRRGVVFAVRRDGNDRVLLLERGHRVPRILYERHGGSLGCGYGVGLSLVRNQLLVSSSDERTLVVLDPRGKRPAQDLWPIVHRIPGFRGHGRIHRVAWAPAWND